MKLHGENKIEKGGTMQKIILVLAGLCFIAGCGKNSDRVDWDVKIVGDTNKPLYIRSAAEQLPVEIKAQTDTVLPVEVKANKEVIIIAVIAAVMMNCTFLTAVFSWLATRNIRKAIEQTK